MKKLTLTIIAAIACMVINAETVHQKLPGTSFTGQKKYVETKEVKGSTHGKVARVIGKMNQWGYVAYWFGIPAPEGESIVRFKIYVDKDPVAVYGVYVKTDGDQKFIKRLKLPKDAKPGTFVTIDIPVKSDVEWSGMILKKFEKSDKPSPWIDTVSIVIPESE